MGDFNFDINDARTEYDKLKELIVFYLVNLISSTSCVTNTHSSSNKLKNRNCKLIRPS